MSRTRTEASTQLPAVEKNGQSPMIELHLIERLVLQSHLPQRGDLITLGVLDKLRRDLLLSEHELQAGQVKNIEGGGLQWAQAAVGIKKKVNIGPIAREAISNSIMANPELDLQFLPLFKKFVDVDALLAEIDSQGPVSENGTGEDGAI